MVPLRLLLGRQKQDEMSFVDWLRGPGALAILLMYLLARALLP
jgi:hypothetical protein